MNPINRDLGSIELNPMNQQHQINIPSASHAQSSQPLPLNLPRRDLFDGCYNEICVPLHQALTNGNEKAAEVIFDKHLDLHPDLVRFSITENYETVLHIAVLGNSYRFVKYLMGLLTNDDVKLQNGNGETALCLAAMVGNVKMADILLTKNRGPLDIPNSEGRTPLYMAALFGKDAMVKHLYHQSKKMTGDLWTCENRGLVLVKCVESNQFDVALEMVTNHPELAINGSVLRLLARKPDAFNVMRPGIINTFIRSFFAVRHVTVGPPDVESHALLLLRFILKEIGKLPKAKLDDIIRGPPDQTKEDKKQTPSEKETQEALQLLRTISENVAKMPAKLKGPTDEKATTSKDEEQKYSSRVLFLAAEMGNVAFLGEVIRQYPHLVREVNDNNQSIFHVAVSYRHVGVFKLLYEIGSIRDLIITLEDKNGNNMLHLAGESAKGNALYEIQGEVFQSCQELLCYKEVKTMLPSFFQEKKNAVGLTPHEVFVKNHKDLFSKGRKWMKDEATQLMVVATLVATISFAAVFTFPGGYNQDTGVPIFLGKSLSKIFIIFDSLSFISSTTAILMALSILGNKHDEYDYITLILQVTICIGSVICSILLIIVTFLISLFLLYQNNSSWLPALISAFAATPYLILIISNQRLHFHLDPFFIHKEAIALFVMKSYLN